MNTREKLTRLRAATLSMRCDVSSQFISQRGSIKGNYLKALADLEEQYKSERALLSAVIKTLYDEIPPEGDNEREQRMEELKKQRSGLALDFEKSLHELKRKCKEELAIVAQNERKAHAEITINYENERIAILERGIEERRLR